MVQTITPITKESSSLCEACPFLYGGDLWRAVFFRGIYTPYGTSLVIEKYDAANDVFEKQADIVWDKGLGCVAVDGSDVYIFGTSNWSVNGNSIVQRRFDMSTLTWATAETVVFTSPGFKLFNTSVCPKQGGGWIMAYERNETNVTTRFLTSPSLSSPSWSSIGGALNAAIYTAAPTVKNLGGGNYAVFWIEKSGNNYYTNISKTTDFTTFTHFAGNSKWSNNYRVLAADIEGEGTNNSDFDCCEFDGRVYINYLTGDQMSWGDLKSAWYDGSLLELFEEFFPKPIPSYAPSGQPSGLYIRPDGLKFYLVRYNGPTRTIQQYSMSTAHDITTASYDNKSFNPASQENIPTDLWFKPDGTKMYVLGYNLSDSILQYNLSTAWDISTAVYSGTQKSVAGQDSIPVGLFFKADGTKIFITGQNSGSDKVHSYALSTAWDISTAVFETSKTVVSQTGAYSISGIFVSSDGVNMYIASSGATDAILKYIMSTPWDLTTATYDSVYKNISGETTQPGALFIAGGKVFVCGTNNSLIFEYQE
jgi:hypothetical protein